MTPAGYAIIGRLVVDGDTKEQLCDDDEATVSDLQQCTRQLDKVRNLQVTWFYVDEEEEDKRWTGTTVFKLKTLDEELKTQRCQWEPEDPKKTLPRGKKKQLAKEVEKLENEDVVMWSNLLQAKPSPPRGWKLLFELFCGCALLTRMAQSAGYATCEPVDIRRGWDVFRLDHRKYVEAVLDEEQPYLLALGYPCGPWSPWQRMNKNKEDLNWQRQKWLPILRWLMQLIRKHRRRGGRVLLLENPWLSEARNTWELRGLYMDNVGERDDYEVVRVDLCRFGLKDKESHLPHLKPTGIGTDSPGIKAQMKNKRCRRDHEHEPLEGSNRYGRRPLQAAQWTPRFCKSVLEGVYQDLRELGRVAFAAEDAIEDLEEDPLLLDGINGPEDLPYSRILVRERDSRRRLSCQKDWIRLSEIPTLRLRRSEGRNG